MSIKLDHAKACYPNLSHYPNINEYSRVKVVRRSIKIGGFVVGLTLVAVGGWSYEVHHQIHRVGSQIYTQFDNDYQPLPPGILDDPIFSKLPPKPGPVTYGRYLPPEQAAKPSSPTRAEANQAGKVAPLPALPVVQSQIPHPQPLQSPLKATNVPASITTGESKAEMQTPVMSPEVQLTSIASQSGITQPEVSFQKQLSFKELLATDQNLHLLLIGNDDPQLGKGRADVLMMVTLDGVHKQMSLLSIPRDTRINLPGYGWVKINAAYAYGGASLQTKAVERFLGIPMDKIIEVSFTGFQQAIDAVGGVNVNPAFAFSLDDEHFQPGVQNLNGEAALAYTRMRKKDPEGDLGRNRRQQEVIRSLIAALGKTPSSEFLDILDTLKHSVRSDFTPTEVIGLRTARPYVLTHQIRVLLHGVNRKIGKIWFYLIDDQERQRLHLLLR